MQKLLFVFLLFGFNFMLAQKSTTRTESFEPPLDDIVERQILKERKPLAEPTITEGDVFWEKRIWRVLDVREKMNHSFAYPPRPLFSIIEESGKSRGIILYSPENDRFTQPMSGEEIQEILYRKDTIEVTNPITHETEWRVVENMINQEDIKRYRIKEAWYFDSKRGQLRVKILGLAPLIEVFDDNGNFRFEKPLFWVYFPELRHTLAHEKVFVEGNDASPMTWDDLFTMRMFASTIYKASNLQDTKITDQYAGVDALLEAGKINQELFNFEHDLWSY